MELLLNQPIGPVAPNTWARLPSGVVPLGPATVVFLVSCFNDAVSLQVQVGVDPEDDPEPTVIEDVTMTPADVATLGKAGFQSSPIPLIDTTWAAMVRIKHTAATDQNFVVRVIAL